MNDLFRTSYRHLDVEPGSSWQEVRQAYKRCVKKWHPDHFHNNDAKTQSIAAEKIKEINCAFDLLSQHYRAHGALPLSWEPPATLPPDTESAAAGAVETVQRPVSRASDNADEDYHQPPEEEKKHIGAFTRLVFVLLLGWLGYTLWLAPDGPTEPPPVPSQAPAVIASPSVDTANRNQPDPAQPKHYFTYGSTVGDVYAIQGIPTKTTDNLWYYGNSKVYFSGGKVTKWEDDPANPLNANADMSATRITATAFGVGSTKAQVRVIQGEPLREWPNVWEYGTSKVYFDGDHVSGWYDSTLNPLQVHK